MPKTAQDKFDEYLAECRETTDAVNEFVNSSQENYRGSYAYAAGALQSIVTELVGELPRARRAAYRERLYRLAQQQKNETLARALRETA